MGSQASTYKTAPRQQANVKHSSSMELDAQKTSQTEEGAKKSSEQLAAASKNSQTDDGQAQRQQRDSAMSQQSSRKTELAQSMQRRPLLASQEDEEDAGERAMSNNTNVRFNHQGAAYVQAVPVPSKIELSNGTSSQKYSQESSPVRAAGALRINQRACGTTDGNSALVVGADNHDSGTDQVKAVLTSVG